MYGSEAKECGVPNHLQTYFREINQISLLSAAEERELAEAIARGDDDARTRMIRANLRLVVRIARDYMGRGIMLDDLIGEGNLGLIRAAEDYDPRFGTRFSTYASYWIKQAIRHALINTTATIRLPAHMFGLLSRWRRAERALRRDLGRAPSFEEVAEALKLSEVQKGLVDKAQRASQLKLESALGSEEGPWSTDECVDGGDCPEALFELGDERDGVRRRLERLEDRERTVLALRYGLDGQQPMTLKEIGRRLGITREWVRKIELRAVAKLAQSAAEDRPAAGRSRPRRTAPAASRARAAQPAAAYPATLALPRNVAPARSVAAAS